MIRPSTSFTGMIGLLIFGFEGQSLLRDRYDNVHDQGGDVGTGYAQLFMIFGAVLMLIAVAKFLLRDHRGK